MSRRRALHLAAFGVAVGLLLAELTARITTHTLFVRGGADQLVVKDPLVGRLLMPNTAPRHPTLGFTMTVGEHSTRVNGTPPPGAERPLILAVGDSFTFGEQVNDRDAWPAILEQLLGHRVINGAMLAFGLDQTVLRAEQLAEIYQPEIILVSFIPEDVLRCEMSYYCGHAKPYFEIDGSRLLLHPPAVQTASIWDRPRALLSLSMAASVLFEQTLVWEGPIVERVHEHGRDVACLLMERLAALARSRNARVIVLAQAQQPSAASWELEVKDGVLGCAQRNGLPTIDLFPAIDALAPERRAALFDGHMTPEGNRFVAEKLAAFLTSPSADGS